MKHLRLTIEPVGGRDESPSMYQVLASAPYLDHVVGLHLNASDDRLGLLIYIEGDIDAFRSQISTHPSVLDFELLATGAGSFYTYFHNELTAASKELFATLTAGSLLMVPPYNYGDGSVTVSLFGPTEEIQSALEHVPDAFAVTVEQVSGMGALPGVSEPLLSTRQRQALEAAKAVGYYQLPRQGSVEEIATLIDCAPSTAAEHLRKAESKILQTTRL
ncbi:helix-turn-helix domain-containing protein [Halocatena halophila]|uniref:helix-turn-helix domain-containing protein n=1 Tax=Halocatena halophila TaxID=2814576 RepID=UPI002ED53C81